MRFARPVKLKLDKPNYHAGDKVKLNVTAPQAGKGYVLLESSDGPLWWQEVDVPEGGTDVEVPLNKEWTRHDLYATAVVVRPRQLPSGDRQTRGRYPAYPDGRSGP